MCDFAHFLVAVLLCSSCGTTPFLSWERQIERRSCNSQVNCCVREGRLKGDDDGSRVIDACLDSIRDTGDGAHEAIQAAIDSGRARFKPEFAMRCAEQVGYGTCGSPSPQTDRDLYPFCGGRVVGLLWLGAACNPDAPVECQVGSYCDPATAVCTRYALDGESCATARCLLGWACNAQTLRCEEAEPVPSSVVTCPI